MEVDTICSRNYSVAGVGAPDSLLMVMNDNNVRVPEWISHDRYFLSLYVSPICEPDLLLPGPLVQPEGGTAYYPNGFVDDGKLYLADMWARFPWSMSWDELTIGTSRRSPDCVSRKRGRLRPRPVKGLSSRCRTQSCPPTVSRAEVDRM